MHLVQQPEEKFLGIVLCGTSKLGSMPIYSRLKAGTVIWAVSTGPEGFEDERQLFSEFPLCAEFPRVYFVAPLQIHLRTEVTEVNVK